MTNNEIKKLLRDNRDLNNMLYDVQYNPDSEMYDKSRFDNPTTNLLPAVLQGALGFMGINGGPASSYRDTIKNFYGASSGNTLNSPLQNLLGNNIDVNSLSALLKNP